jgi:hypothetical protein
MDEQASAKFRARLRTRANRQMALIGSPWIIFIAVAKILEPMSYPAGDIRNSILFRLGLYGLFIVGAALTFVSAVRWLLATDGATGDECRRWDVQMAVEAVEEPMGGRPRRADLIGERW